MNEYYKLAADYFKEFEPRSSFPGLNSCHWYLWLISLAFFVYFGYHYFLAGTPSSEKRYWQLFGSEIAFLLSCGLIAFERWRLIVRATSEDSDLKPIERLGISKRARLEMLLGRPAWQFMATAKEIIELRSLEKACRSAADKDLGQLWGRIYDPEAKARLLTLLTALLGLVIAVLGKNEAFNIVEALADEGTWALIKALAQLAIVTFILCVAAYHVLRQMLDFLTFLFSSVFPVLHNRQITLDYFLRDLIEYHRMEPPMATPVVQAPVQTPASPRAPVLGTLIAAVCLVLLRQSSASRDAVTAPAR